MTSVICTLFENKYHRGVAALTNSLYKSGFRGEIYAGYRGSLPPWSLSAKNNDSLLWPGAKTLNIANQLDIHFLPVQYQNHLAHFKPDFMLQLFAGPAKLADGVIYFDPDIVVKCNWRFYEKWMRSGVAIVHEVLGNDMPASHPTKREWEKVVAKCNRKVVRNIPSYINSGFCGVLKENVEFLSIWSEVIERAIKDYDSDPTRFMAIDKTVPFYSIDQDAFNVAAMCCQCPISEIGPEGMDFIQGGWLMSHAVGSPKPWSKNFLLSFLNGYAPSKADKGYWKNVKTPIEVYSNLLIKRKDLCIKIFAFLGRFYRRY